MAAVIYIFGALSLGFILSVNLRQIICHLRNYTEPLYQRYILRIIFIVPVTAITAFCSTVLPTEGLWFDTIRQWYEAWVIYNFTSLLLAYVGGPGEVEVKLDGKQIRPSCLMCTCCVSPRRLVVNGLYVKTCKQLTLQFVYVITPLSIITVILFERGLYMEGDWKLSSSYLYVQILYNISYGLALSALFFFYYGTKELLQPFNPVLKFVTIKGVVFLTFWQGILCSMLYGFGVLRSPDAATALQDFLILLEMVAAAAMMYYAFPWWEYQVVSGRRGCLRTGDIRHAVSIHDVVSDTFHTFAPAYHDYVLYSDGTAKSPKAGEEKGARHVRKSFRARTFLMMGQESSSQLQGQSIDLMRDVEMNTWDSATSDCGESREERRLDESPEGSHSPEPSVARGPMGTIDEDPFSCSEHDVALELRDGQREPAQTSAAPEAGLGMGHAWSDVDLGGARPG